MTALTWSRSNPSNHSMMSSMLAPASRFSKMADTGIRVPFRTHAPLTLPGMLSTAGHCDQSRLFAMFVALSTGYREGKLMIRRHTVRRCGRLSDPRHWRPGTASPRGTDSASHEYTQDEMSRPFINAEEEVHRVVGCRTGT